MSIIYKRHSRCVRFSKENKHSGNHVSRNALLVEPMVMSAFDVPEGGIHCSDVGRSPSPIQKRSPNQRVPSLLWAFCLASLGERMASRLKLKPCICAFITSKWRWRSLGSKNEGRDIGDSFCSSADEPLASGDGCKRNVP